MSEQVQNASCCAPSTTAAEVSCCAGLSEREQALIALSAAIALNNGNLVKQAVISAKEAGINNDEIGLISEVVTKMQGMEGMTIEEMAAQSQSSSSACCR
jgi:alkylhydroperoxidase/carboxymuconolactone decarboxylase family protein YurZ